MNGIHEVTGSIPVWSTTFLIFRKSLNHKQLAGSIVRIRAGRKTLIRNTLQFETKLGSNRGLQLSRRRLLSEE